MRILVVMDPLAGVDVDCDTTFGFLLAAQARGHDAFCCGVGDLCLEPSGPAARCTPVEVWHRPRDSHRLGAPRDVPLSSFDTVWMRVDPPVDWTYLHATYLLDGADALVVNRPSGLRDANEHLYALRWPELGPEPMVSNEPARIRAWLEARDQPLVVKPLDGHGGLGVFVLERGDRNVGSI